MPKHMSSSSLSERRYLLTKLPKLRDGMWPWLALRNCSVSLGLGPLLRSRPSVLRLPPSVAYPVSPDHDLMVPSHPSATRCATSRYRLCSQSFLAIQFLHFPSPRSFVSRKGHHLRAYCLTGISLAIVASSQLMTLYLHLVPSHHQDSSSDINFVPFHLATRRRGWTVSHDNCLGHRRIAIIHAIRAVPDGVPHR